MLKGSLKILSGNMVSYPFHIAKALIIAKALEPATYGILNLFNIILSYSLWCECGIVSGMDKLIPFLNGKLDFDGARQIQNIAFTWFSILYLCLSGVVGTLSYFMNFSNEINIGLRFLSILILLSAVQNFYITLLRAKKKFGIIGATNAILAVSMVCFVLLFYRTNLNRLHATLLGFIAAYCVSFLFCQIFSKMTFKFNPNLARLKEIVQIGLPLVVLGICFVILISVDRWMIARYFPKTELGYYAFGATIANLMFTSLSVFAYVFFPFVREYYGKNNDLTEIRPHLYKMMFFMSYFASLASAFLIISFPIIYKVFFSKYLPGLISANYLVFGTFFISLSTIMTVFLVGINKQKIIIFTQIIGIIFSLVLNFLIIKMTNSINGVAFVTALVFAFYGIFIIFYALGQIEANEKQRIKMAMKFLFPFWVSILIIWLLRILLKLLNLSEFILLGIEFGAFGFVFGVFFWSQNKKEKFFEEIKTLLACNKK